MSQVRIGFSGSISFLIGIIRIFLGLAYITVITRTLSPEEFGNWQLILGLIGYVTVIHTIETFWSTREVAREKYSTTSTIFSGGIFSGSAIIIYLFIIMFVSTEADVNSESLLVALILVPTTWFFNIFAAINNGWKPQNFHYGLVASDIVKLSTIAIFLQIFGIGIFGVIFSAALGNLVGIIFLLYFFRSKITWNFDIAYFWKRIKLSWLSLYSPAISIIFNLDVLIFTLIIGNTEGLGYYGAILVIASIPMYAELIFSGVYPKLLGGKDKSFLGNAISRMLYILFPLTTMTIAFGYAGLHILNPVYTIVFPALVFLVLRFLGFTLFSSYLKIIRGLDAVDIDGNTKFKDFIKSKLFFAPTLQLIHYSLYAIALGVVFVLQKESNIEELIRSWTLVSMCLQIPFSCCIILMVRREIKIEISFSRIIKYLLLSIIIFGTLGYVFNEVINFDESSFTFIIKTVAFISLSMLTYILITYLMDSETKRFVKSIINEIKSHKKL